MTGRATFGEFAATAARRLDATTRGVDLPDWPGSAGACADVPAAVRSAMRTLSGYTEDVCNVLGDARLAGRAELRPWIRAASQVRQRLATAEAFLQTEPGGEDRPGQDERADQFAGGLRAAVLSMRLGRDLLHTHLDTRPSLAAEGRSEWAPIVTSAPVACALLNRIGGWASQIAPLVGRVASSGRGITPADRRYLYAASQGLWAASWTVGEAQERQPVRQDRLQLLEGIPVNALPAACSPAADTPVTSLCDGVISTAERLRAAARQAAARAAWSPAPTRESLRQTAGCCAITASSLRIVLRTLAEHHGSPDATLSTSMADAAAAADSARATWLQAAEAWDDITTDTRSATSRTAAEAAGLALWTGRLAYASRDWTPALGPRHLARPAAELAATPDQLRHVIDAIHHACHTLAQVAEADRSQARSASMTGRLIVPTRSLPDSFELPYRFAPAPGTRSAPLLSSYDLALQASNAATDAMAEIAADVEAPSQILTAHRAAIATRLGVSAEGLPAGRPMAILAATDREHGTSAALTPRLAQPVPPGPVERILLDLDITSADDLRKAAALDTAADQLILRAAAAAQATRPGRDPCRSAGTAELITHLVAANGDRVTAALLPVRPAVRVPGVDGAAPRAHFSAAQMNARQAEPEAGA